MQDKKTIRFVTANYSQLQGLRLIPIGLLLILGGVVARGWGALARGWLDWVPLVAGIAPTSERARVLTWMGGAIFLLFALAIAAPAYYRQRYGSVDQLDRRRRDRWITAAVIGYFVLARVDRDLHWPVSLSLLLVSVSLFITVCHDGRVRAHYLAPGVAWLVVSFLPALDASSANATLTSCALGGLTLIWCGIGDHLLITRTLAKPRTTDNAPQPAAV